MKKPGAISRPGAIREFQFNEYRDSSDLARKKRQDVQAGGCQTNFDRR
jgi:hypothetical protein